MTARAGWVVGAGLVAAALTGCQSTQDKAAALKREGSDAFERGSLRVGASNPDVKILSTSLVRGAGSAAVVVRVRNASKRALKQLPIAIDVRDTGQRSVFRNDRAGQERSLVQVALLRAGEELSWVNDQVLLAQATPRDVAARVGAGSDGPRKPPRMLLQEVKLERDGDATVATGYVRNASRIAQRELVVYAVGRRGGRVVAAGRAQIKRLTASQRRSFTVFFVGDARGAQLELSAPPTVLGKAANG